jgi:DNA repair ATPase RecN
MSIAKSAEDTSSREKVLERIAHQPQSAAAGHEHAYYSKPCKLSNTFYYAKSTSSLIYGVLLEWLYDLDAS